MYFGYTPAEWQVAGIIGGLVIGAVGLVCRVSMDFYFKSQHLKIAQARAGLLVEMDE